MLFFLLVGILIGAYTNYRGDIKGKNYSSKQFQ
jgi:hypothetical protein